LSRLFYFDDRYAALFGSMTYLTTVIGKNVTSPFAVYDEVLDGVCCHAQSVKDPFASTDFLRSGGTSRIESDPNGEETVMPLARCRAEIVPHSIVFGKC
jgi:hypothetical protein